MLTSIHGGPGLVTNLVGKAPLSKHITMLQFMQKTITNVDYGDSTGMTEILDIRKYDNKRGKHKTKAGRRKGGKGGKERLKVEKNEGGKEAMEGRRQKMNRERERKEEGMNKR